MRHRSWRRHLPEGLITIRVLHSLGYPVFYYIAVSILVCSYAQWAEVCLSSSGAVSCCHDTTMHTCAAVHICFVHMPVGCWCAKDFYKPKPDPISEILHSNVVDIICSGLAHRVQDKLKLWQVHMRKCMQQCLAMLLISRLHALK